MRPFAAHFGAKFLLPCDRVLDPAKNSMAGQDADEAWKAARRICQVDEAKKPFVLEDSDRIGFHVVFESFEAFCRVLLQLPSASESTGWKASVSSGLATLIRKAFFWGLVQFGIVSHQSCSPNIQNSPISSNDSRP